MRMAAAAPCAREAQSSSGSLACAQVAPAHTGVELGIGDAILLKALSQTTGRADAQLKKEMQDIGDLGEVALKAKGKQRTMFQPKPLTVRVRAYRALRKHGL